MSKYIVLVGSAGSGKSSIEKAVLETNNRVIKTVSSTTRPIRETENGTEYNFMSEEEFIHKMNNGEFIECRKYNTKHGVWWYGLEKSSLERKGVYLIVLDIQGLKQLTKYVISSGGKERDVISIFINASSQERYKRYFSRDNMTDENRKELDRRFAADERDVESHKDETCMVLRNEYRGDFQNCLDFIDRMINILND